MCTCLTVVLTPPSVLGLLGVSLDVRAVCMAEPINVHKCQSASFAVMDLAGFPAD